MSRENTSRPRYVRRGIAALSAVALSACGGALAATVKNQLALANKPAIVYSSDQLSAKALVLGAQMYKTSRQRPANSVQSIGQAPYSESYQVTVTTNQLSLQRHRLETSFPQYRFLDVIFKAGTLDDGVLPPGASMPDGSLRPGVIASIDCGVVQPETNPLSGRTSWIGRASLVPAADGWQEVAVSGSLPHQADPCAVVLGLPLRQG